MENSVISDTLQGIQDAIEFVQGDKTKGRARKLEIAPVKEYSKEEIKAIRVNNNMTLRIFAEVIGVSPKTVEAWEAGTNKPRGSAARLFQLMEADSRFIDLMIVRQ